MPVEVVEAQKSSPGNRVPGVLSQPLGMLDSPLFGPLAVPATISLPPVCQMLLSMGSLPLALVVALLTRMG